MAKGDREESRRNRRNRGLLSRQAADAVAAGTLTVRRPSGVSPKEWRTMNRSQRQVTAFRRQQKQIRPTRRPRGMSPKEWWAMGGGRGGKISGPKQPSPQDTLASVTNEDFQNFQEDFVPVMEDIVKDVTDPQSGNTAGSTALQDANLAFDRNRAIFERQLARTGTKVNQGQRRKLEQQFGLGRARTTVNAANLARRAKDDENLQAIQGQIEAGQSLRGNALAGLGAAAGLQGQREQTGAALAAQAQQQTFSNIGSGAGIGFAVGGPVGGLVGAGVGLLASLF